jgi:hypothetical protein
MEKELVDLFEYRKDMLVKASAKASAKALPKTSAKASTTVDKPLTSYFKPSTKKGSGLLLNLNSI